MATGRYRTQFRRPTRIVLIAKNRSGISTHARTSKQFKPLGIAAKREVKPPPRLIVFDLSSGFDGDATRRVSACHSCQSDEVELVLPIDSIEKGRRHAKMPHASVVASKLHLLIAHYLA